MGSTQQVHLKVISSQCFIVVIYLIIYCHRGFRVIIAEFHVVLFKSVATNKSTNPASQRLLIKWRHDRNNKQQSNKTFLTTQNTVMGILGYVKARVH